MADQSEFTWPPPPSIPLLDLSAETHCHVVVDREPGQYLGHPTTVLLEDGRTIIAVYPKGHGRGPVVMKRSTDGGLTWSDRLPVPENWATSREVPTVYRVVDGAGTKRLIMFSGLYPVRMARSEDDGETWTPLEPIGDFGGVVAMADLVRLADGGYMALFHDDGRFIHGGPGETLGSPCGEPGDWHIYKSLSHDGGLTWSSPDSILKSDGVRLCEPGAVRSPDGGQIAVLLREESRTRNSFIIFSDDEGETWSEPRQLPSALTGDRHQAVYAADGRLVISFRDMAYQSPTGGDWVCWVGVYDDLVHGGEGHYRVRLKENFPNAAGWTADCAYPGIECLPDGTIVTTTYGHWVRDEMPYILSVRLCLAALDARAAAAGTQTGDEEDGRR
jgi:hypothetical protein